MRTALLVLWCVVYASCRVKYDSRVTKTYNGNAYGGGGGGEHKLGVLIRGDNNQDFKITDNFCKYEFQMGEEITLSCTTNNLNWKLLWRDEVEEPVSSVSSGGELHLRLRASAGDAGARFICVAFLNDPNYQFKPLDHITVELKPKHNEKGDDVFFKKPEPVPLRPGEPLSMQACHSGRITQTYHQKPEKRTYKRGDVIFNTFQKKNNGTVLYCNNYDCPPESMDAVKMKNVVECTRKQQQHVFLVKEDSRGDITNSAEGGNPVRFPESDNQASDENFITSYPFGTPLAQNGSIYDGSGRESFKNNLRVGVSFQHAGSIGETINYETSWKMRNDGASGGSTEHIGTVDKLVQNNGAGGGSIPKAGASKGSPAENPESKQTAENVAVVVGAVLGAVVVLLLVVLGLVLRRHATRRALAPSEPYVVYTELAEPRRGGIAPPPPPRNLPPYACVVGTLVPATPKLAPRPISNINCTVK